jgi:hypothetical protein
MKLFLLLILVFLLYGNGEKQIQQNNETDIENISRGFLIFISSAFNPSCFLENSPLGGLFCLAYSARLGYIGAVGF